jgi:hypothetical protein
MARTPGPPGIYPSELLGVYLASQASPPYSSIHVDNQGAVKALLSQKKVVRHSFLVNLARASVQERHQVVQWVKGHAGQRGNELADTYARKASSLPPQPSMQSSSPFSAIVQGLAHFPPHKCWTEVNVPTHRHTDIHPISFAPLKRNPDSLPWVKWLFGLCWRPGWASYQSFWSLTPSRRPCPVCLAFHNTSIHGTLSFCEPHPLRQAWLAAWQHHPVVLEWLKTASHHDRVLLGKVCIPRSLYSTLTHNMGRALARKLIQSFQHSVVSSLNECLNTLPQPVPATLSRGKRRRVWVEADWDNHTPAQHNLHQPAPKRPQHQPLISTILRSLTSPHRPPN